jgi:hypothetical protein
MSDMGKSIGFLSFSKASIYSYPFLPDHSFELAAAFGKHDIWGEFQLSK